MLPAAHRLRRRQDFAAAIRHGRRAGRPSLVVHLATAENAATDGHGTDGHGPARVGFVIGKTVGPAVVRNRVKRRLRHLVAARLDALPEGSVLVVRALPVSAEAPGERLAADLDSALRRLRSAPRGGTAGSGKPAATDTLSSRGRQ